MGGFCRTDILEISRLKSMTQSIQDWIETNISIMSIKTNLQCYHTCDIAINAIQSGGGGGRN